MTEVAIILILGFLSIMQSIFGVGLLLFGTPTFIIMGFNFNETLAMLLPLSISISFLQVLRSNENIANFKINFNFYCIPFLITASFLVLKYENIINFKLLICVLLILTSVISLKKKKFKNLKLVTVKYQKLIHTLIGLIHGMTNMGGGFLSIFSFIINNNQKYKSRKCIAYSYLIMGIFQYIVLLILFRENLNFQRLYLVLMSIFIFFISQFIFKNISEKKFSRNISLISLVYGLYILCSLIIN